MWIYPGREAAAWEMGRESAKNEQVVSIAVSIAATPEYFFFPSDPLHAAASVSGVPMKLIIGGLHLLDFLRGFNISCRSWKAMVSVGYG